MISKKFFNKRGKFMVKNGLLSTIFLSVIGVLGVIFIHIFVGAIIFVLIAVLMIYLLRQHKDEQIMIDKLWFFVES